LPGLTPVSDIHGGGRFSISRRYLRQKACSITIGVFWARRRWLQYCAAN
jgi:hypothetical protein